MELLPNVDRDQLFMTSLDMLVDHDRDRFINCVNEYLK